MKIPPGELESTKDALRSLIDERSSAPWADYDSEDEEHDDQDYEDIDKIKTVLDALRFLRDQGDRTILVEYYSCLDPLGGFQPEDPDYPDEEEFRAYLIKTYKIDSAEFPTFS